MEQNSVDVLLDLVTKLQIFLARPNVQLQLMVIAGVLVGAGVINWGVNLLLKRLTVPKQKLTEDGTIDEASEPQLTLWQRFLMLIRLVLLPVITLAALFFAATMLLAQGEKVGLLTLAEEILMVFLGYRIFVGLLYVLLNADPVVVGRFQGRLFGPLLAVFVLYEILSVFVNIPAVAQVLLPDLFANPVTLGAVFLATVGLYFWINSVLGLTEVIVAAADKFTNVNVGRLEASLGVAGYVLIGIGLIVSLSLLGVDSTTFAAITAGLSVGVGFALQTVLSSFVSGILLLFEGSIRPGDWVILHGKWYAVRKINVLSTQAHNWNGGEVFIPNQEFLSSIVTNYTLYDDDYRMHLYIYTGVEAHPETVKDILRSAVIDDPRLLPGKPIHYRILKHDHTGSEYLLRFWINPRLTWSDLMDDIFTRIYTGFEEAGVNIRSQHDIHIRGEFPWGEQELSVPKPAPDSPPQLPQPGIQRSAPSHGDQDAGSDPDPGPGSK